AKTPASAGVFGSPALSSRLRGVACDHAAECNAAREQQQAATHDQRHVKPSERKEATLLRAASLGRGGAATGASLACSPTGWRPTGCNLTRDPARLAAVAGTRRLGERGRRQSENSGNGCKDAHPSG
ncbi:MAG: hypothetical protein ACRDK5_08655, partial [Solirubrobacterales bacterium]